MLLPLLLILSVVCGEIGPERRDQLQKEIVKTSIMSLIRFSKTDTVLYPMAERFHFEGCQLAAFYNWTRYDRYMGLREMIDSDREFSKFVKDTEKSKDEYIDDWLEITAANLWRVVEMKLDGRETFGRLCTVAFSKEFIDGDYHGKLNVALKAFRKRE